ncbi:MAG: nucleotidyltransferase domain-containing protein [bacterium]|nr:nucleotidyltransferase domain-containing protein [bacterium]
MVEEFSPYSDRGKEGSESFKHVWEEIEKNVMPKTLAGTSFEIPYKLITARQLVTRAEFAKETAKAADSYQYIGRKVNRKTFIHPLSHNEYMVIKSNRGNSPQLFFSYDSKGREVAEQLAFGKKYSPEDISTAQVSRFSELIKDERMVELSRVREGINIKGRERLRIGYIHFKDAIPRVEMLLTEDAWKEPVERDAADYSTKGVVVKRGEAGLTEVILFAKAQSRHWNNATVFAAALYKDGALLGLVEQEIPLKELSIFEEIFQENPQALFDALQHGVKSDAKVPARELGERASFSFPATLDSENILQRVAGDKQFELPVIFNGKTLPKVLEEKGEVRVDPEADEDLNRAITDLKREFGDSLLGVYFYGSIPRGYKHLQSDVDVIAVIDDKEPLVRPLRGFEMEPSFKGGELIHGAIGSYHARSRMYPFRSIEVHTIYKKRWGKPSNFRLGEFLRNVRDGAVEIYKKQNSAAQN